MPIQTRSKGTPEFTHDQLPPNRRLKNQQLVSTTQVKKEIGEQVIESQSGNDPPTTSKIWPYKDQVVDSSLGEILVPSPRTVATPQNSHRVNRETSAHNNLGFESDASEYETPLNTTSPPSRQSSGDKTFQPESNPLSLFNISQSIVQTPLSRFSAPSVHITSPSDTNSSHPNSPNTSSPHPNPITNTIPNNGSVPSRHTRFGFARFNKPTSPSQSNPPPSKPVSKLASIPNFN